MASHKTITIVGVTGLQGSAVAKTFLQTPGWHVRGISRSKKGPAAQKIVSLGVEVIEADLDDKASLIKAFEGSHTIFANTDFFALTKYPNLSDLLATTYVGLPLNQACKQHELMQGGHIVEAAAQVLSGSSNLSCFVLSTASHAKKWSGGQISNLLHFDAKAEVESFLMKGYPDLAAITRFLYVGFYMSNILMPVLLPRKAEDGVFEFRWANIRSLTELPATSPEQDVGAFVKALISAPPSTTLLGVSDPLTVGELLRTWSDVTGQPSRLVTISTPELEAMIEPEMPSFGKEFAENFQYYRDFTYTGRDPRVILPEDLHIDKSGLTTYRQYLEGLDWKALLSNWV